MARQKKAEQAGIPVERFEHVERLADSVNEDLTALEDSIEEINDRLDEIHDAFNDNATILQQTVDTVNQHAQGGNALAEAINNLRIEVAALKVLHQGARADIKREREAGAFGREELLAKYEDLQKRFSTHAERFIAVHRRIDDLSERVWNLENPPTLWERIKARFGSES